jgi:hypothetical protein
MEYSYITTSTGNTGSWQVSYVTTGGTTCTFVHPGYIFKSTILPARNLELADIQATFPTDAGTEEIVRYMQDNNSTFDDGSTPY